MMMIATANTKGAYYVPGTVLSTLHTFIQSTLTTVLWGKYYYCLHFTSGSQRPRKGTYTKV